MTAKLFYRILRVMVNADTRAQYQMSETTDGFTCSPNGRSHAFENLWVVDGSTFPFLPAKNLTFTLMANAARIADAEF